MESTKVSHKKEEAKSDASTNDMPSQPIVIGVKRDAKATGPSVKDEKVEVRRSKR